MFGSLFWSVSADIAAGMTLTIVGFTTTVADIRVSGSSSSTQGRARLWGRPPDRWPCPDETQETARFTQSPQAFSISTPSRVPEASGCASPSHSVENVGFSGPGLQTWKITVVAL